MMKMREVKTEKFEFRVEHANGKYETFETWAINQRCAWLNVSERFGKTAVNIRLKEKE